MKSIQSIPFVWLPLLTLWTIILALFRNLSVDNIEFYIPLVIYIPVSFIFSAQYGLLLKDKKEFLFTKLSSSTSIIICFLISTISIFYYIYGKLEFQKSLFFIVLPLVANLIINEFLSISNKEWLRGKTMDKKIFKSKKNKFKDSKNATSREISLLNRKTWKTFLKKS